MRRLLLVLLAACSSVDGEPATTTPDATTADATPTSCTTTITYGDKWLRAAGHDSDVDIADGDITWDGTCVDDGANSYAVLSNGWKPYFAGKGSCAIALDSSCAT